ncbi:MAG: aminopeptidase [Treponema sp.]|nr:aminopeptidase [Treponema sp.]MDD7449529.1 aminopeptidase [Treponema sp.]MDY2924858.1 aminopeptidase [Treponema sp.]
MEKQELIAAYKNFLDKGKTERECVAEIIKTAEKYGYKNLDTVEKIKAGDKVYIQKMNKSIALFKIGTEDLKNGLVILGAHIDSPRLDIKQNPLYERDFAAYLNTHYYGGIKKYQWVTLPLAIHGVVCKTDGSVVNVKIGEDENDPVFCISDILPHLAHKQMKDSAAEFIPGEKLDLIAGTVIPSKESDSKESKDEKQNDSHSAKKMVLKILKEKYNIEANDFLSAELEVVPAGKSRDCGFDGSLILGYGQDDRVCAFTSFQALMDSEESGKTLCCLCVDKEEIGSVGGTGMASHLFENMVAKLIEKAHGASGYSDFIVRSCLENSFMLSSDVNAAYDPQNGDLYDKDNASFLNGGVVFNKYTGSRGKSGASDANAEYLAKVRNIMEKNGVKYQMAELGKVDQGGGGTIALYAAKYGMNVLDAGVAVLSMHAPWELTAKEDILQAYNCYKAFLSI